MYAFQSLTILYCVIRLRISLFLIEGAFNPTCEEYDKYAMIRASVGGFMANFYDEEDQVNGIVSFSDVSGFTMQHQTYMTMDEQKRNMKMWQVLLCARTYTIVYIYIYTHTHTHFDAFLINKLTTNQR